MPKSSRDLDHRIRTTDPSTKAGRGSSRSIPTGNCFAATPAFWQAARNTLGRNGAHNREKVRRGGSHADRKGEASTKTPITWRAARTNKHTRTRVGAGMLLLMSPILLNSGLTPRAGTPLRAAGTTRSSSRSTSTSVIALSCWGNRRQPCRCVRAPDLPGCHLPHVRVLLRRKEAGRSAGAGPRA